MKILITGSSGLIGSALTSHLQQQGHQIGRLLRINNGHSPYWNIEKQQISLTGFESPDVIIHLAGENIAARRWTTKQKNKILMSRVNSTELIADFICQLNPRPKLFICASAIGYYGNQGNIELDEQSAMGDGFASQIAHRWEQSAQRVKEAGVRLVNIRIGIVMSHKGGVLPRMAMPAKFGLGSIIGDGSQYMSWISIEDMVNAIEFVMHQSSLSGVINLVSPKPVTHRQLMQLIGQVLHKPILLRIPKCIARILFGEIADELILASTRVLPKRLLEAGYSFKDTELTPVLQRHLVKYTR